MLEYREKLRGYYNNIAGDKVQSGIGADELEDPLITMGITNDRTEVENILNSFKTHIPGKLNFEEFVCILNGNQVQKKNNKTSSTAILEFFRNMIEGKMTREQASSPQQTSETLPFTMTVSSLRRKKLLELLTSPSFDSQQSTNTIKAYGRLIMKKRASRGGLAQGRAIEEKEDEGGLVPFRVR